MPAPEPFASGDRAGSAGFAELSGFKDRFHFGNSPGSVGFATSSGGTSVDGGAFDVGLAPGFAGDRRVFRGFAGPIGRVSPEPTAFDPAASPDPVALPDGAVGAWLAGAVGFATSGGGVVGVAGSSGGTVSPG